MMGEQVSSLRNSIVANLLREVEVAVADASVLQELDSAVSAATATTLAGDSPFTTSAAPSTALTDTSKLAATLTEIPAFTSTPSHFNGILETCAKDNAGNETYTEIGAHALPGGSG